MSRHGSSAFRLAASFTLALTLPAFGESTEIQSWTAPPFWAPPASADQADRGDTHPAHGRTPEGRQALAAGPTALPFISLFPCRLVDTRGNGAPLTGGFLPSATVRSYALAGVCGVPSNAKAISLNATVVKPVGPGFLTIWPEGGAFPPVSTLNFLGNDVIVNAAVVPLSATGGVSIALGVSGGDVILDTNGYYAQTPTVTSLNAQTGDLSLVAGSNVTLTPSGNTLTIAAAGGGGGGGTVTSVGTGAGLTGGPITLSGSLSVASLGITTGMLANNAVTSAKLANGAVGLSQINSSQVQARVTGTCPPGSTIQTIHADGTAFCAASPFQTGASVTRFGSADNVGEGTSIAVGRDGLGLISYFDATNHHLKVAHCSNPACTATTFSTLDTSSSFRDYTSIAIGSDGLGLISYWDYTNNDLKVAHCSNVNCSSATTYTLDSTGDVGSFNSIAIGTDGLGLISYYDQTNQDLKVAHCSNASCSTATTNTVDSTGFVGFSTSIKIGSDGLGLIAYYDGSFKALKTAHCSDVSCSSATVSLRDVTGGVLWYPSIAIGSDGLGLISYLDSTNHVFKVAHCVNIDCSGTTVSGLDGVADVGYYNSTVIGPDGLGLISYYDQTNGDLKVAHCSNVACTSATYATLDSGGNVGLYTSLAIGPDGLGLISYYDATNGDLKVARMGSGLSNLNGLTGGVTLAGSGGTTVTQSGSTLTIAAPAAWNRTGNAGTSPGTDFLGTTDGQPLRIVAAGGVGINTSTPEFNLDVASATDTQIAIRSNSTGGRIWTVQSSDGQAGGTLGASFQIVDRSVRSATQSRLLITTAGDVGIGTTDPLGFKLAVNGSAAKPGGGSWSTYSDARLKRDIRPLERTLDRLLALRGVSFEYIEPAAIHELPGTRIGMVAQDVERVFPDWVSQGPDGYRHLTFRGFEALAVEALRDLRKEKDAEIGVLKAALEAQRHEVDVLVVKAVQEQQAQLAARDARIASLEKRFDALERANSTDRRIAALEQDPIALRESVAAARR